MMTTSMLTTCRCVLALLRAALLLGHSLVISKYYYIVLLLSIRLIQKHLTPSFTSMFETLLEKKMCVLFYMAGLQLQEGVHCSSGSSARHGQRFLENDLGEERADSGHADTLQRTRTREQQHKHNILTVKRTARLQLHVSLSGQMRAVLGFRHQAF